MKRNKKDSPCLVVGTRDGNGADRDWIMGDPNPPRTKNM